MNEQNYSNSYQNGSTKPPKNRGGVIATVLCCLIILIGVISVIGPMVDIRISLNEDRVLFSGEEPASSAPSIPTQIPVNPDHQTQIELLPIPDQVDNVPQAGGLGLQEIYDKCIHSVVSISCTFSGGSGSGTGVVLSQDGYIVTNAHVIDGAQSIEVLLTDGRTFAAQLVGSDTLSDLAVLYINTNDLISAEFGDSSQLRVGDAVVAIGDPLGVAFRGTMTDGIVSAINRNVQSGGRKMTLIQTNAALNSGNSGGPLINCFGQVIGINTMKIGIFADDAGVEGLGFAIPSAVVQEIVNQLLTQGYVSGRPALGLTGEWVSSFDQIFRRMPAGLYITTQPENTEIQTGDILLYIDDVRVTGDTELENALYAHKAGDEVTVTMYRSGSQYTTTIILKEVGK